MKFKKLSAAVLASAMALTASPVFAAYSPDASDKPSQDVTFEVDIREGLNAFEVGDKTYVLGEQDRADVSKAEKNAMDSVTTDVDAAQNRKEIIKAAGYDVDKFDATIVLGAGFYELIDDETNRVVNQLPGAESFTIEFSLEDAARENFAGKSIYVMHFDDTKKAWEVKTAKVDKKGSFAVTLESLSPLSFVGALGWEGKDGSRPAINAPSDTKKPGFDVPTDDGNRPEDSYKPGTIVPGKPDDTKPGEPSKPGTSTPEKPENPGTNNSGSDNKVENNVTLHPVEDGEVNTYKVADDTYVIEEQDRDKASKKERDALDSVTTDADAAENRKEILKRLGYDVNKFDTTVVLGYNFYVLKNEETNQIVHELPGGESFTAEFDLDKPEFAGKDIYVMHYLQATDSWDVQIVHVNKNGCFKVKLNSLSPLAFIGAQGWERDGKRPAINAPGKGQNSENTEGGAVETPVQSGTTTTGANALITKTSPNTAA